MNTGDKFLVVCLIILMGIFIGWGLTRPEEPSYEEREDARNSQQMVTDNYGNHYMQDRITKLAEETDLQFNQRIEEVAATIKGRGNYILGVEGSVGEINRVWIKYNPGSPPPGYKEPSLSAP